MFKGYIEKAIEARKWDVLKKCEEENVGLDNEFKKNFTVLMNNLDEKNKSHLRKLDEIYASKMLVVMHAYEYGFNDAKELMKINI